MTTTTQSRTIDGIGYAASRYVYDNQGDGIVTDILYYDQSGTQVADRTLYEFSPFANSARIDNSDGTFSIKVTLPPAAAEPIRAICWIPFPAPASGSARIIMGRSSRIRPIPMAGSAAMSKRAMP